MQDFRTWWWWWWWSGALRALARARNTRAWQSTTWPPDAPPRGGAGRGAVADGPPRASRFTWCTADRLHRGERADRGCGRTPAGSAARSFSAAAVTPSSPGRSSGRGPSVSRAPLDRCKYGGWGRARTKAAASLTLRPHPPPRAKPRVCSAGERDCAAPRAARRRRVGRRSARAPRSARARAKRGVCLCVCSPYPQPQPLQAHCSDGDLHGVRALAHIRVTSMHIDRQVLRQADPPSERPAARTRARRS